MTIAPVGGELVDASATIVLQVNESCAVHSGTGLWYSVGRGRNQQFNFTQLSKTVTGGTTTLTLTEAANIVQTYSGTLLSNEILVLPAVVQVYYIANNTSGAYAFTIKSPNVGSVLVLPTGQSAVIFCDGTNVINASTSVAGISSLLLVAGSAASPSLAMVNANNGLFAPTGSSVGVSAGGSEVVRWSAGQELNVAGSAALPSYSFTASASTGAYSPAANQWAVTTNGVQRLLIDASGNVTLNVALPVTSGGTGSTTAGAALSALGAQAVLVSATNIKTINSTSILGAGDLVVSAGLTRVQVSGTTQAATAGNDYWAENVAATTLTAPTTADGAKFAYTPANGLLTNTIDFGATTVRGPAGTVTGTLTLDLGLRMEFEYSTTLTQWVSK